MIRVFRLSYPYSKAERMSRAKLGENAVKSSLGVHRLIEDLCLKLSILGKNSRNNITGRSLRFSGRNSLSLQIVKGLPTVQSEINLGDNDS